MKGLLGRLASSLMGAILGAILGAEQAAADLAPPENSRALPRITRNRAPVRRYGKASSGCVRRVLNLRGMPAFNEYRQPDWRTFVNPGNGFNSCGWAQNRNAAKARRRRLREAPTRTPWHARTDRVAR